MHGRSLRLAGLLMIVYPSVMGGGAFLLSQLARPETGFAANALRQDMFRAGHAHAGVLLALSLILLRYVDETDYRDGIKQLLRSAAPLAAVLMPLGFFLSVASPKATTPNALILLVPLGGLVLASGVVGLGLGLLRARVHDGTDHERLRARPLAGPT